MAIFYNTDKLPAFRNAVITIGTFDGVHEGHRKILREVVKHAAVVNGESIVITFEPHPRKILFPGQPLKILTPLQEKLRLITASGIHHVVVIPFTKTFSNLSAGDYIDQFLVKYFHPDNIIIGYDHHFGHDRTGDIGLLRQFENKYHYKVVEIPAQLIREAAVSSTKIRNALLEGRVDEAAQMTGRPYNLAGTVQHGAKLGRTIGYPTANLLPSDPDQLVPASGIYAVRVQWDTHLHNGMLSIGFNPTVTDDKTLKIEVHLFDFSNDIYGKTLELLFVTRLRDEEKFASLEALKEQLHRDKLTALKALS